MSSSTCAPDARPRPSAIERFVRVPVDLVLAYRTQGANAAVYALVARLCEITRGPVALSRDDLALLFNATRDDATGVRIERAIRQLRSDGWLLHPNQGQTGKRQLVVTWGHAADGAPRPWQFGQADRARPRRLATVRVPLALFDLYLGRLILQADAPAQVERYVSQPLLDLVDISTFITRQIGGPATTPRLEHLGLLDTTTPDAHALLVAIAHGTRAGVTGTPVALTPAGMRHLQRCQATGTPARSDQRHGSSADPQRVPDGSSTGSAAVHHPTAPGRAKPDHRTCTSDPWESHGMNQQMKVKPIPHESHEAPMTAAAVISMNNVIRSQTQPPQATDADQVLNHTAHRVEELDIMYHTDIEPRLTTAHRWLNAERAITDAEWWTFAQIVQDYGAAQVWAWQQRALAAGRTSVTLGYYAACAATAAFEHPRSTPLVAAASSAPAVNRAVVPAPTDALASSAAAHCRAARTPLSPAHQSVLARISDAMQTRVRYPEKLATASLDLLEQWARVAAHPGLQAKGDPAALFVHAAAQGKQPPSVAELNRWAEQHGTHWSQLDTWANTPAAAESPATGSRRPLSAPAEPPATGSHMLREAPTAPMTLQGAATVQQRLVEQLQMRRPRSEWSLFANLRVAVQDEYLLLICSTHQQRATLDGTWRSCIQSALADVGEQRSFRLVVAGGS